MEQLDIFSLEPIPEASAAAPLPRPIESGKPVAIAQCNEFLLVKERYYLRLINTFLTKGMKASVEGSNSTALREMRRHEISRVHQLRQAVLERLGHG